MESRQGKSESKDSREVTGRRHLCRAVIVQALRDLGRGNLEEVVSSRSWRKDGNFNLICDGAAWDRAWVDELFDSIECLHSQPESVRNGITLQCIRLLKGLSLE